MEISRQGSLVLRSARPEDEDAVRALLAAHLPGNPKADPRVMRWQYHDNPYGSVSAWVWEEDGRIVGHYATYPVPVLVDGRPFTAGIGVDAVTAPSHQGRGLFSKVIQASEEDGLERNFRALFYFPGAASRIPSRGRAIGWPFSTYVFPIDASWLASRLRLPKIVVRASLATAFRRPRASGGRVVDRVPDGIDELWTEVAPRLPYGIVKDERWWRWRYGDHPHHPYRFAEVREDGRLRAAAATLVRRAFGGRVVYVLELLVADRRAARAALAAVIDEAVVSREADAVAMCAMPGSLQADAARTGGLRTAPRRLAPNPLWLAVYSAQGHSPDKLVGRWAFTWGDMDHL